MDGSRDEALLAHTVLPGVTDAAVRALAEAGCGQLLNTVDIRGEWVVFPPLLLAVGHVASERRRLARTATGITGDSFAAALGLPVDQHGIPAQDAFLQWSQNRA